MAVILLDDTIHIPETHFRLLRLAILRAYPITQTGPDVFTVASHSQPKHAHTVNPAEASCCCPAFGWCAHLALALDRWMSREAGVQERGDYLAARRLDFGGMHRRDVKGSERTYLKDCVERASVKYAHLFVKAEREEVSF